MSVTLAELAQLVGGTVLGDETVEISGVNTLEAAAESEISFLASPRYRREAEGSAAGAVVVSDASRT